MHNSSILSCFAFLLLVHLTLAAVSTVQTANGPKTIGCVEYIYACDNSTQDRCCNGGNCTTDPYLNPNSLCFPKRPYLELDCGETYAQCDTGGLFSQGCCSDLDKCECSLNDTAICVCMPKPPCIAMDAACTSTGYSCCGDLTCQCPNGTADCKCLTKPPPPCLEESRSCDPDSNRECCGDFTCVCDRNEVNCKCGIPPTRPPPPKPKCLRRDNHCEQNPDICSCNDRCTWAALPKRYECKQKPKIEWMGNFGCTPDNCVD